MLPFLIFAVVTRAAMATGQRAISSTLIPILRQKGYDYDMLEAKRLYTMIGRRGIMRLPHRDELGVVPGFGEGSAREVGDLIQSILRSLT